ncbi:MAG: hypothetical protein DLM52_08700 [Chthoniobacterales bacterium]|nr:MAG: hypothetical protein DLM52_08700 [Chthoniobacterales bacterium]
MPEVRTRASVWWESISASLRRVRYPVGLGLSVTVITFAFGICAAFAFGHEIPGENWLSTWNRWDASSFLDLARNGYPHETGEREHLIVLLPLYPLAIRFAHFLIPDWHFAAVAVSNACSLLAFVYLFRLARLEYGGVVARRAVLFCAIFPTAYFLHIAYSESLFLFLSVAAFYYARRGKWVAGSLCGVLATATRLPGAAIFPALLIEYLQQRKFSLRALRWDMAALLLVPLGTVSFLWLNYSCFGDPLHFLAAQRQVWGAFLRWPFPSVADSWYGILHSHADERVIQYGGPFAAFILLSAALIAAVFFLRPCYTTYLALSWIVIFCNNFPVSSPRYVGVVFPLFLLLGRATTSSVRRDALSFLFTLFYALCAAHFVRGWWGF